MSGTNCGGSQICASGEGSGTASFGSRRGIASVSGRNDNCPWRHFSKRFRRASEYGEGISSSRLTLGAVVHGSLVLVKNQPPSSQAAQTKVISPSERRRGVERQTG